MINFKHLEDNKDQLREEFLFADPFSHLVIDNFCDADRLELMIDQIPELENKSRDYIFAANKFEKSNYKNISPDFSELYYELNSDRMNEFLSYISRTEVFVDNKNFGGGLHQGKKNSFLDMHLDFNYHTLEKNWYRTMNLLLYLNRDWKEEYGGQLNLEDRRTGKRKSVGVPCNRMIIQLCGPHTLHGYDRTNFPEGVFRHSIATYVYTIHKHQIEKPRTTDWHPNAKASSIKKFVARYYDPLVKVKNKLFGSGTAKNQ